MNEPPRAEWARALSIESEFEREQARLGHCWTLLAIDSDLKNDGDWVRATLGGRSVFVQRFGDRLRGYENRCAHRFFPLRTADKGNGPVICGFHHWRYNEDGLALGIPHCVEVFGTAPRELNARLNPIEIACCGSLVFGRFPGAGAAESLEDYLGDGFAVLKAIVTIEDRPHVFGDDINANWRLLVQITLDDYHLVAVHHRKAYSMNEEMKYYRFGAGDFHSAQFVHSDETMAAMAARCRAGTYTPTDYRIFNIFPNLAVSLFKAKPYWYCNVQQFVPVAVGKSKQRGWFFRTRFTAQETAFERLIRPLSEPIRARVVRHFIEKIGDEDHRACEQLQSVAHQVNSWPLLCTQEKRVEWLWDAYTRAMTQNSDQAGSGGVDSGQIATRVTTRAG